MCMEFVFSKSNLLENIFIPGNPGDPGVPGNPGDPE